MGQGVNADLRKVMVILALRRIEVRSNVDCAPVSFACRRVRRAGIKLNGLGEKGCLGGGSLHGSAPPRAFKQLPKRIDHMPCFAQIA